MAKPKMEPWQTPALIGSSFEDFPSRTAQSQPSATEKKQNKAKYQNWNSIRFEFVKKTNMPHPARTLDISSVTPEVALQLIKALDFKPYWKSEEATFANVVNNPIIYKFSKDFTNNRKKSNRMVVFRYIPLPNILKYMVNISDLHTTWKTKFPQIYWRAQLECTKVQAQTWIKEPPLGYNQDHICLWWVKIGYDLQIPKILSIV